MPPLKKNKVVKEEKTTLEQKVQAAINSSSYCMIPHLYADYVTVRNPITGKDHHLKTDSEVFLEMVWDLTQRGMKEKILKDLTAFSDLYDPKWTKIIDLVNGYIKGKETANVEKVEST